MNNYQLILYLNFHNTGNGYVISAWPNEELATGPPNRHRNKDIT